jgi:hypothetical protein
VLFKPGAHFVFEGELRRRQLKIHGPSRYRPRPMQTQRPENTHPAGRLYDALRTA